MLPREGWPNWMIQSTFRWARVAVISGIAFVVGVFFYYVAAPWNLIGKTDPVGGETGYEQVAARAREQLQATGASWIATTDYRTYAMLRWHFNGQVPVIQINERGRYQGFADPGMNTIKDHPGLYVAREPDNRLPLWDLTTATRQPLAQSRARLARRGDGYLCAGKIDGLDAGAVAAAELAVVPLARAGRNGPGNAGVIWLRDPATSDARGLLNNFPPSSQRAQRRPGACRTRGPACLFALGKKLHTSIRFGGSIPAFPAQWLYGFYSCSSRRTALLPPSPAKGFRLLRT